MRPWPVFITVLDKFNLRHCKFAWSAVNLALCSCLQARHCAQANSRDQRLRLGTGDFLRAALLCRVTAMISATREEMAKSQPGPSTDLDPEDIQQAGRAGPEEGNALSLSGGGYRAMIFHLGALWRLNEVGILSSLNRISSVSGGSITAGVLGMNWKQLDFDGQGRARNFESLVVEPIRRLARKTLNMWSILEGLFDPSTNISARVAAYYQAYLFHGKTLQDLPTDAEGPRFVINASNVQMGAVEVLQAIYGRL